MFATVFLLLKGEEGLTSLEQEEKDVGQMLHLDMLMLSDDPNQVVLMRSKSCSL